MRGIIFAMGFGGMSYPDEDKLKEELAPQLEEKKISNASQSLMRKGLAQNARQAQLVLGVIFILTVVGSVYFFSVSQQKTEIVPRDPYLRTLPARL